MFRKKLKGNLNMQDVDSYFDVLHTKIAEQENLDLQGEYFGNTDISRDSQNIKIGDLDIMIGESDFFRKIADFDELIRIAVIATKSKDAKKNFAHQMRLFNESVASNSEESVIKTHASRVLHEKVQMDFWRSMQKDNETTLNDINIKFQRILNDISIIKYALHTQVDNTHAFLMHLNYQCSLPKQSLIAVMANFVFVAHQPKDAQPAYNESLYRSTMLEVLQVFMRRFSILASIYDVNLNLSCKDLDMPCYLKDIVAFSKILNNNCKEFDAIKVVNPKLLDRLREESVACAKSDTNVPPSKCIYAVDSKKIARANILNNIAIVIVVTLNCLCYALQCIFVILLHALISVVLELFALIIHSVQLWIMPNTLPIIFFMMAFSNHYIITMCTLALLSVFDSFNIRGLMRDVGIEYSICNAEDAIDFLHHVNRNITPIKDPCEAQQRSQSIWALLFSNHASDANTDMQHYDLAGKEWIRYCNTECADPHSKRLVECIAQNIAEHGTDLSSAYGTREIDAPKNVVDEVRDIQNLGNITGASREVIRGVV